jgi:hypothetical protein
MIRSSSFSPLAVLVLVASIAVAGPAQAVPTVYAYNPNLGFGQGGASATSGAAVYSFGGGPLRISIDHETWNLRGSLNFASAEFGRLRASTRLIQYLTVRNGYNSNAQGAAAAGFTDTVTFNTGTPGEAGVAQFLINVDGSFSSAEHTLSGSGNFIPLAGFRSENLYYIRGIDYDVTGGILPRDRTVDITSSRLYSVNFTSGVPVNIGIALEVYSWFEANGPGLVVSDTDFSHTLSWGGLFNARSSSGQDLTRSLSVTSGSGVNYLNNLAGGVPEPSLWATMILGFGLVGSMLRRRGRSLVQIAV